MLVDKQKAQRNQKQTLGHQAGEWQSWNLNPDSVIHIGVIYHYFIPHWGSRRTNFLTPMFQMGQLRFREPKSWLGEDPGLTLDQCYFHRATSPPSKLPILSLSHNYGAISASENLSKLPLKLRTGSICEKRLPLRATIHSIARRSHTWCSNFYLIHFLEESYKTIHSQH